MAHRVINNAINDFLRTLHSRPLLVTTGTVTGFTLVGLATWNIFGETKEECLKETLDKPMTLDEARVRAMIENAQSSSWQQNLDNAGLAQDYVMLPGRNQKLPPFMKDIDRRSREILRQQHQEFAKEQKGKDTTTTMWS